MSWKTMSRGMRAVLATSGAAVLLVVGAGCAADAGTTNAVATPTSAPAAHHAAHARAVTPTPTPSPVVTTKLVQQTAPIPFGTTTIDDAARVKGTSAVTTKGVDGVRTTTYRVTYTNGVETGRTQVSQVVTTAPVTQVTTVGTYVAPAPAPAPAAPAAAPAAPAPTPAPAPAQSAVIIPGAYCSASQVGEVAQSSTGKSYKCGGHGADARGDYHWNTIP